MGLISPGGENLLDFLELQQVLSTYDGDLRDLLWWPHKGHSPCELLGGPSGFLSLQCRGLRACMESGLQTEDSSPVLTWNVEYFCSLHRGVSPQHEWGHAGALTSRAVAAVSRFPSRGSRHLCFPSRLSHEAFPWGFSTGLSHEPPWCESILGVKVEAVQGKQVPLE